MTQYLLAVHHARRARRTPATRRCSRPSPTSTPSTRSSSPSGSWVFGGGLTEPERRHRRRRHQARVVITDGPFAETKEQLGGFWVVEAPDLDAALELARRGSAACRQPVEVRPFQSE